MARHLTLLSIRRIQTKHKLKQKIRLNFNTQMQKTDNTEHWQQCEQTGTITPSNGNEG